MLVMKRSIEDFFLIIKKSKPYFLQEITPVFSDSFTFVPVAKLTKINSKNHNLA